MSEPGIEFVDADEQMKSRVAVEWGEKAARYMHLEDGFAILAVKENEPVGLISVYWKALPETCEAYSDILEVRQGFRRRGIAAHLIGLASERAKKQGAYQLRAWSSLDKTESIPMWKALDFGLCPATTYPQGQEIKRYFVVKLLSREATRE